MADFICTKVENWTSGVQKSLLDSKAFNITPCGIAFRRLLCCCCCPDPRFTHGTPFRQNSPMDCEVSEARGLIDVHHCSHSVAFPVIVVRRMKADLPHIPVVRRTADTLFADSPLSFFLGTSPCVTREVFS